jgi:hypothetical protein
MDKEAKIKGMFGPHIVNIPSWLEDCPDLYVQLICNPAGIGFPYEEDTDTRLHCVQEIIRIGDLDRVLREHAQKNIWRSWQVFSDKSCSNPVSYIPLFFDIDNEAHNLEDAYNLTLNCVNWLERTNEYSAPDHLRVVFSGMKGFHIEAKAIRPTDNQLIRDSLLVGLEEMGFKGRGASNHFLQGTIDPDHDFIRLTGSFNSWKEDKTLRTRKVIQLSLDEFRSLRLETILERAEAS